MLACLCTPAFPVWAKETDEQIDPASLQLLARDFVSKIGGKLKAYDTQTSPGLANNLLTMVPDGEMLLLRPKSGKFVMDAEIAAIGNKGMIYYSLQDLINALELAIDYNPETRTGSGWFLREDWLIRFDFNKGEVVARGKTYKIASEDIYDDQGDIYISGNAARDWFSINATPDIAQQFVEIVAPLPYPALARNYREEGVDGRRKLNLAKLPRAADENRDFDINIVETQQTMRMRRRDDGSSTTHTNSTSAAGEILGHNAYGFASWDSKENITSVRGRLTKDSENPDLLGPLGARSYTLGDTDLPQLPLTGYTSQELGVRINNNPLKNADFQRTTISGDSLPGWDVELYRDGFLVDRIRVEDDSRYEFADIELFSGDNLFDVFFYGPQGEIRKDSFNIPVNEQFLATQDNTYDMSLTFNDAQTYSKFPSEDEDANAPHLLARYNKIIGDTLTYAGFRARQQDGEQKAYLGTGFTKIMRGTVLDGNAALDEQANKAFELTARKNIDNWRLSLTGNMQDEDYSQEGSNRGLRGVLGSVNRNFIAPFDTRLSLNSSAEYQEYRDDRSATTGRFGLSHQMGSFTLSNTTQYRKTDGGGTIGDTMQDEPRIDNTIAARLSQGKVFTTAGLNYNVKPESDVDSYFGQISYYPTNKFSSDLRVRHEPRDARSEARLSMNYKHDKFRISPYIDVDNKSELETGVRLSTTLVDRPNSTLPMMTSDRLIGRGMVSSFVFFDKNGNNIFDDGDEPLPDVYVQSMNIARRAPTDDKGYSLIRDLPEKFVTDIQLDVSTLPDPFMIPGFKGASVFPKSGETTDLVFPVHLGGEIDGFVYVADKSGTRNAGNIPVNLISMDKGHEVTRIMTANDGYYVMSSVAPGNYLLSIDAATANRQKAGGMAPLPIHIGYDGTVYSGKDITLQKGRVQVPIDLMPALPAETKEPVYALQTGSKTKNKLASLLERMITRKNSFDPDRDLQPLAVKGEENIKTLPGKGLQEHYDYCQTMNDEHLQCRLVILVPENGEPVKTAQK